MPTRNHARSNLIFHPQMTRRDQPSATGSFSTGPVLSGQPETVAERWTLMISFTAPVPDPQSAAFLPLDRLADALDGHRPRPGPSAPASSAVVRAYTDETAR